jgi:hypothetical protein
VITFAGILGERTANGHETAQGEAGGTGFADGAEDFVEQQDFAIIEQNVGAPSPRRRKGQTQSEGHAAQADLRGEPS